MNKQMESTIELVKQHIQSIDETAEIILLFPKGKALNEELQIYVLTSVKVDFETEQHYRQASYQIELAGKENLSIYIYSKDNWHRQLHNTPIYKQITEEGIAL